MAATALLPGPVVSPAAGHAAPIDTDTRLRRAIARLAGEAADHWDFAAPDRRPTTRALFQYPAMMVPAMQRELISAIVEIQPTVRRVLDPFAGSGTVQCEAMALGLNTYSQDINPLSTLLCRAKSGSFDIEELRSRCLGAIERARSDSGRGYETHFPGLRKWFTPRAIRELSRLRRAIREESALDARRFLWVALAETVRLTSNSRTSTYKLHIRPHSEIDALRAPIDVFAEVASANLQKHAEYAEELRVRRLLDGADYRGQVVSTLADTTKGIDGTFDLLVTSPPYGDNGTTVPYGQASFLPLQWIDLADIDPEASADYLETTLEIDRRSLGGHLPRGSIDPLAGALSARSAALTRTLKGLADRPRDRAARVLAFMRDLAAALEVISGAMRPNAYMVWTLGNRRVGDTEVPLGDIVTELLHPQQVVLVEAISRRISGKRMAVRNSIAATMKVERTLIFRRCP